MYLFFIYFILLIFRERGKDREREREKHQHVVASRSPSIGDMAQNPGMCPDWESNQQPSGSQAGTQSIEPHQQRPLMSLFNGKLKENDMTYKCSFIFPLVRSILL